MFYCNSNIILNVYYQEGNQKDSRGHAATGTFDRPPGYTINRPDRLRWARDPCGAYINIFKYNKM